MAYIEKVNNAAGVDICKTMLAEHFAHFMQLLAFAVNMTVSAMIQDIIFILFDITYI